MGVPQRIKESNEKMEVLINTLKEMTPFIKDWGALIIAGISLLVAIISLLKSSKAQRLQNKVNELELKIKRNELDKIAKEKEDAELASRQDLLLWVKVSIDSKFGIQEMQPPIMCLLDLMVMLVL